MLKAVEGRGLRAIIRFFGFIILVAGFVSFGPAPVFAQAIGTATRGEAVPDTCDVEFMKSLEARSWMEAERENVQNQNLIVKSESVMEYTCFMSWLNNTANDIGMFSEGLGSASMDTALQNLVANAWLTYMQFYEHNYLGGRSPTAPFWETAVTSQAYGGCGVMNSVWQEAKCYNFQQDDQPQDGFFTLLSGYVEGADPRIHVEECAKDGRWAAMYLLALEEPLWMPEEWAAQARPQYFDLLDPGACTGAVPTGITIELVDGTTFPDAVCSAPGCWYDGGGCN